jgi:LytR cell envelope-related transcriptional attenuator
VTSGESFGSSGGGGVGGGLPPIRPRQRRDVRGWLGGQRGARLVGVVFALAGIALLILGLVTLRGKPGGERPPGAAPTTSGSPTGRPGTPTPTATPTTRPSATGPPATPTRTPPPPTTQPPAGAPRFPLTVLNNTVQAGLAEAAAARFSAAGWPVALVGNFAGRIPSTTVYYAPGDTAQQRSAQTLASQFPGIHRVMQRYSGLPPTPPGLVVVITPDWTR